MHNNNDLSSRTVTLNRTFNAPIALVWEAWTKPEHIVEWWSPKGMKTDIIEHQFKVGGAWRYDMHMPDGNTFIAEGIYTVIKTHEEITSKASFKPMTEDVEIQALFKSNGDITEFTFNIIHPTEAYKIAQEKMGILNGWGSVFERLDAFLLK